MTRLVTLTLLLAACGEGSTEPTAPSYPSIGGAYLGTIAGVTEVAGVGTVELRDVDFTLTVLQNDGNLSGTYGLDGSFAIKWLDGATSTGPVSVVGAMAGTITTDGRISMSFVPSDCPSYTSTWGGMTTASGFELSGTLDRLDSECVALFGVPVTVILVK